MGLDADWLSRCSSCASHWFLSAGGGTSIRFAAVTGCWGSGRRERRSAAEGGRRVVWRLGLVPVPRPRCRALIGALGTGPAPRTRPRPRGAPGVAGGTRRGHDRDTDGDADGDTAGLRPAGRAATEPPAGRLALRPGGEIQAAHPSPEPRDRAGRIKSCNGSNFLKIHSKPCAFPGFTSQGSQPAMQDSLCAWASPRKGIPSGVPCPAPSPGKHFGQNLELGNVKNQTCQPRECQYCYL